MKVIRRRIISTLLTLSFGFTIYLIVRALQARPLLLH